jgi:hypothetical protein
MKKKSLSTSTAKLIMVVSLIVGIGAIIGIMGYFWTMPKSEVAIDGGIKKENINKEEVKKDETVNDETADWQTYRNEEYGFEVKYPQNLEIKYPVSDVLIIYAPSEDKKEYLQIQWFDINTTLPFTLKSNGEPVGYKPKGAEYVGKKIIGEKEAVKFYADNPFYEEENDFPFTNYIIKLGDREWINIGYHGLDSASNLFEKIVSTFKFIETTEAKNLIIYPSKQTIWKTEETYLIQWKPKNPNGTVDIRLYDNVAIDNATRLIFQSSTSPKDTGNYSFTVFKGLKSGDRYQFQITQYPSNETLMSEEFIVEDK